MTVCQKQYLLAQQDDFRVDSYPDYYVIDRAGNLRIADMANAELDRVVEILLKEKP